MQRLFKIDKKTQLITLVAVIVLFGFFNFQILRLPQQSAGIIPGSKSKFVEYSKQNKEIDKAQTRPKPMHNEENNKLLSKPCKKIIQSEVSCFNFVFEPAIVEDKVFYQSDLLLLRESIEDIAIFYYSGLGPQTLQAEKLVCATDVKKTQDKVFLINLFSVDITINKNPFCSDESTRQSPQTFRFTRVNENNGEFEEL